MDDARTELAHFLRTKRHQVSPSAAGLEDRGRRRTPGLRREEVSLLSGVSLTWYTWLEQARDVRPSVQVVDALAKTLRLTPAEHGYVLRLIGHPAPRGTDNADRVPPHAQQLLDALGDSPAYALTPTWSIIGWNAAYEAFYPGIACVPPSDRNLLWLVFTDPQVRLLHTHWDSDSRHFLAQFRAETGPRIREPAVARLVERLHKAASSSDSAGPTTASSNSPRGTGTSSIPSSATYTWRTTGCPCPTTLASTWSSTRPSPARAPRNVSSGCAVTARR